MNLTLDAAEPAAALNEIAQRPAPATSRPRAERALNVAAVYEDEATRQWARAVCARATKAAGPRAVRSTWWRMSELGEPAVLAGAVSKAMRADVIVVAAHAGERMPLPFYVWVEAWLPHRPMGGGLLMALLELPAGPGAQLELVQRYLRALARQGRLAFMLEERRPPAGGRNGLKACSPRPSIQCPRFGVDGPQLSTRLPSSGLRQPLSAEGPAPWAPPFFDEMRTPLQAYASRRWHLEE